MKFNIFNLKKRRKRKYKFKRRKLFNFKPVVYDMVFMPANSTSCINVSKEKSNGL